MSDELENYLDPSPRPQRNFDDLIKKHSTRAGVDENLVRAIIGQESSGNIRATSPKGAGGLMQLMPATAQRFGVKNVYDPDENIRGGTDYLKFLNNKFKGNTDLVLAGYNAGEGAVDKFGGIPPYRETRNYVPAVKARYQKLTGQQSPSGVESYLDPVESYLDQPETPKTEIPQGRGVAMARAQQASRRGLRGAQPQVDAAEIAKQIGGAVTQQARLGRDEQRKQIRAQVEQERQGIVGTTKRYLDPREWVATATGQDVIEPEVDRRIAEQERLQTPEVIAGQKAIGRIPGEVAYAPPGLSPRGLATATTSFLGNVVKSGAGAIEANLPLRLLDRVIGKNEVPKVIDYVNSRGQYLQDIAAQPLNEEGKAIERKLPEKATEAVANLGLTIGQIVLLKRATGMSLGSIMATETALRTSDLPPDKRAIEVAGAYGMGKLLDQHLSRPVSALAFGAPTAIETGAAYAQGKMSLEDALLQTGVQSAAGALLGGKPKGEINPEVQRKAELSTAAKEAFRLPVIEDRRGSRLSKPIEITYESESGKEITKTTTVGKQQKELLRRQRVLEKLVDCLHG